MRMKDDLFRGKKISNGEWRYGFLLVDGGGEITIADRVEDFFEAPIDRSTVGRCTYLTDKNGMEIFEGDILSAEGVSIVRYSERKAAFIIVTCDGEEGYLGEVLYGENEIEVIGNVYDNSELLEEACFILRN